MQRFEAERRLVKHEDLYRHEIDTGVELTRHVEDYRHVFDRIRPHEPLARRHPLDVYLEACPTIKSTEPELRRLGVAGHSNAPELAGESRHEL